MPGLVRQGVILAAAGLAAAGPALAAVSPAGTTRWRVAAVVHSPSANTVLYAVTAAGARHAWAVGFANPRPGSALQQQPVVEAWDGSAWLPAGLPPVVQLHFGGFVDTVAATIDSGRPSVWAFAMGGAFLHYDGATWTTGDVTGGRHLRLTMLASLALGANRVWAFGGTGAGPTFTPYAVRLGPGGWIRTPVPGRGMLVSASAAPGGGIWAVLGTGLSGNGQTSRAGGLVRWHAGRWHQVSGLPAALRTNSLGSVLARSDTNIWVGTGLPNRKGGTTEAIGHWNGHRWTLTRLRAPAITGWYHIISIVPDGSGGLWALGYCDPGGQHRSWCPPQASRLWHQSGGQWTGPIEPALAKRAAPLYSLAASAKSVWAAGAIGTSISNGLIALWGPIPR